MQEKWGAFPPREDGSQLAGCGKRWGTSSKNVCIASPAPPVVEPENVEHSSALQLQAQSSSGMRVGGSQIGPQGICGDQSGGVLKFLNAVTPPMPYLLDA